MMNMLTYLKKILTILLFTGIWNVAVAQDHIHSLDPNTHPIHLRVVFGQNPAEEATIAWTTTEEGHYSALFYDTESRNGDGGLGVSPREVAPQRWYLQEPGMTISAHNVHLIEFNKTEIYGRGIRIDGVVLDEFHIPADRQERAEYFRKQL